MKHPLVIRRFSILLLAGALALSNGCGTGGDPLAPLGRSETADLDTRLIDVDDPPIEAGDPPTEADWSMVSRAWVHPGQETQIQGSRYRLTFTDKSVDKSTLVTIHELDSKMVDVEFGPDGTQFDAEVYLEIDYAGTSSDPRAANFHGERPALFYHNPVTKAWEEVPTLIHPETHRLVAVLRHFSRYAMYQPTNTKEGEWQWTQSGPPPIRGERVTR